jgi:hypothetical protein
MGQRPRNGGVAAVAGIPEIREAGTKAGFSREERLLLLLARYEASRSHRAPLSDRARAKR